MGWPADTKSKILDAAEALFAEHGLDRVSIRDITEAAGANIAAVNYHFGSKQELIAAVFERRIRPLNQARMDALDAVEKATDPEPPSLRDILEAYIRPTLTCCQEQQASGRAFAKLFGRCLAETRPELEELLKVLFSPLIERLTASIARALPHLSRTDIFWRLKFTSGVLHHWLLTRDKFIPEWAENLDLEAQSNRLIAFVAAGFEAR